MSVEKVGEGICKLKVSEKKVQTVMNLIKTKKILKRLQERYGDTLDRARLDIKPDYSGKGYGISTGVGYVYRGIDITDRNFIYDTICTLAASINDPNGPISFDIDHFVTDANAVKELDELGQYILRDLTKLKELKEKYKNKKDCAIYPLESSLSFHQKIFDILEEIFNSEEYLEFKSPNKIKSLSEENLNLKFEKYWRKRKWRYIFHLLAFFPFIIIASWIIYHKNQHDFVGLYHTIVLISSGLLSIIFSYFFNNHSSFKDSWKLIFMKSRNHLKEKEKNVFKQKIQKNIEPLAANKGNHSITVNSN